MRRMKNLRPMAAAGRRIQQNSLCKNRASSYRLGWLLGEIARWPVGHRDPRGHGGQELHSARNFDRTGKPAWDTHPRAKK
jgi:hypothetical protein